MYHSIPKSEENKLGSPNYHYSENGTFERYNREVKQGCTK